MPDLPLATDGTRVVPPPAEARPRLEARLRLALQHRLALVIAAPGYGKTSALARATLLDPRPPVWHPCVRGESSDDIVRHFGTALGGPFGALRTKRSEDEWRPVVDVVAAARRARLLLIDDVQHLVPDEVDRLIAFLCAGLPPGWSAVVTASRELEHPELVRMLARDEADRLDERDLAFDQSEARAAAATRGWSHQRAQRAWARASGWPLGVLDILSDREATLTDYFEANVLDGLPSRLLRFVESTVILGSLSAETCREVTRMRDAAHLLKAAAARHLFLLQGQGSLAYLPLFRTALLGSLQEHRARRLARFADRVVDHYVAAGDTLTAFDAARSAGRWTTAVALLRRLAPDAVATGRGSKLLRWVAAFPATSRSREPWLLHFQAVGLRLGPEDVKRAWRLQEQARDAFRAAGIEDGYAHAVAELGTLACLLGRPAESGRLLEEAKASAPASSQIHYATLLCSLADAYVALGRLRDAARVSEEALAAVATGSSEPLASMRAQALNRLAFIYLRQGELARAEEVVSHALELGREHTQQVATGILSSLVRSLVHLSKGDLELSLAVLDDAAGRARQHVPKRIRRAIDGVRAEVLALLGRLDESDRAFSLCGEPTGFLGDVGILRLLQGRLHEAQTIFRRELEESDRAGGSAEVDRAKAALGVVALRLGQLDEAKRWLLDAARGFEQSGARLRLAGTQLHLAHLHLLLHDSPRCMRYLRSALDQAAEAGSYNFFLWDPATVGLLARRALREQIHVEYVEALCIRRLRARELRGFVPLLSDARPELRSSAKKIVDALLGSVDRSVAVAELDDCKDSPTRLRLTRALLDGRLTARGLLVLRRRYSLTWAETDAFVQYYLVPLSVTAAGAASERRSTARRLQISENTLRHHITSVRGKLGLRARRGSASVLLWSMRSEIAGAPSGSGVELGTQQEAS